MKTLLRLLGILVGSLAVVFGEFDDSPGLQGLGLIVILIILFRSFKRG